MKCPFCKSNNTREIKRIKSWMNNKIYTLWFCKSCLLEFFTPLKFENVTHICPDYEEFHKGRKSVPEWTKEVIKFLKKHNIELKNKKILEIGAGDCVNFIALKNSGLKNKNYYAVEIDEKAIKICKKRGINNIFHKFFNKKFKTDIKFDIILCLEVLEHQTKPKEFLKKCFSLLKKDGLLIISVPNKDRFLLKERERGDIPPHHFLRFNKSFFRKNFREKIMYIKTFRFKNKSILLTSKRISLKIIKTSSLWFLFIPLSLIIKILDSINGEGLIVVLRK